MQNDMLSAQYTTKDGSRREVNLIPNAQIEDQLFNQLADKKVDVAPRRFRPRKRLETPRKRSFSSRFRPVLVGFHRFSSRFRLFLGLLR